MGIGSPLDVALTQVGEHQITLTATDAGGASLQSTLAILVYPESYGGVNQRPVSTIMSPRGLDVFSLGEEVVCEGSAVDPEEGSVPSENLVWEIIGIGEIGRGS